MGGGQKNSNFETTEFMDGPPVTEKEKASHEKDFCSVLRRRRPEILVRQRGARFYPGTSRHYIAVSEASRFPQWRMPPLPPFIVLFAFLSSSRQPLSVESSVNSISGSSLAGRLRGI